jgi:NADH-quinone oxidoreductase subunit M
MLLSGIMLKMGTYSLIRCLLPIVPDGFKEWQYVAITLSVIGVVYASVIAIMQRDIKKLLAYSSIAHVGMIALGILANGNTAYEGALIEMVSHGVIALGLFFIADMIESRVGHDHFNKLGGLREKHPAFAFLFFVIVMASVALPVTSGFVGEFLLLQSIGSHNIVMALVAGLTVVFGAVYMLRAFQSTMLGKHNAELAFAEMTASEKMVLTILVIITIAIGVYPGMLLDVVHKGLQLTGI